MFNSHLAQNEYINRHTYLISMISSIMTHNTTYATYPFDPFLLIFLLVKSLFSSSNSRLLRNVFLPFFLFIGSSGIMGPCLASLWSLRPSPWSLIPPMPLAWSLLSLGPHPWFVLALVRIMHTHTSFLEFTDIAIDRASKLVTISLRAFFHWKYLATKYYTLPSLI